MKHLRIVLIVIAMAYFGIISLPKAKADEWDKKTIVTFSGPVELPGIVLPAGTYVFKLADSDADRNIVQVFNKNENHIYATLLAVPDYRMEPKDKTVITFEERPKGSPEAIRAWFYPGSTYGEEFVYPKPRAAELAKANQQHVPSMPAMLAKSMSKPAQPAEVKALKNAPVTAIQPSGQEVQLAEVHPKQTAPPIETAPIQAANSPRKLPKTASSLPWLLLIGTTSLSASLATRLARKTNS